MLKTALLISIISITNPKKAPEISISAYYKDQKACYKQLDILKKEINAEEIIDKKGNRVLRLENREYHHRNYIFWSCLTSKSTI